MKKMIRKSIGLILPAALVLSGCQAAKEQPANDQSGPSVSAAQPAEAGESESQIRGIPFGFQVKPEDFSLSFQVDGVSIPVSEGVRQRTVANYEKSGDTVSWQYPDEEISVMLTPKEDYLSVEITSDRESDNSFVWPGISSEQYYIPFGEGKRIPADDSVWKEYLDGESFDVMEQLSMPFWSSKAGEHSVLFIMENPYRTEMNFSAEDNISFSLSHEYPEIDSEKTNRFRIYVTEDNPVHGAKLYRNFVMETGRFRTLEQKAGDNPNIRKLYGAPFVYLAGDMFTLSVDDVNWPAFRRALSDPIMDYLLSFAKEIENGTEFSNVIEAVKGQDFVDNYQKNVICSYLSRVLNRDDFWNPSIFTERSPELELLLANGYESLNQPDKIQVHKYALAAGLPDVFGDAGSWMDDSTVALLTRMKEAGIDRAWIALHGWEDAYTKPELTEAAEKQGYLIASYDSYHSIHKPGSEQWLTAKFDDTSLYENATVTGKDGEKISGFQNVGRKLNPTLSMPSVINRMEAVMANRLPFNSWFIDCDATGEIYDDYTPEHITTQQEDLAARLERMSYIRDQYHLVIGSEGGNDYAASTIAFAHGIELKSFSWMDEDMKNNKDSEYYVGKFYNPAGGVTLNFSKRVPLKDKYYTLFVDPRYDIPLFKLVYNDSVITSYHWDWSTFKIEGATKVRMLREVLYNVPPLYHLDAAEWARYGEDIENHQAVWSGFSSQAVTEEMTDFEALSDDGSVQKTCYGDSITAVANFGGSAYQYGQVEIPALSILIQTDGTQRIYTPSVSEANQ